MTPGDFASLQEGREGLSTEDYIAWKLPEEEEEADYPFPLTLKAKKNGPTSPSTAARAHPSLLLARALLRTEASPQTLSTATNSRRAWVLCNFD